MKVHMLSLGPLGANCYILETDQKNAIAVDIGGDPEILLRLLRDSRGCTWIGSC
ncbi:MBL fold metallo-hydrolase [Ruminococcus champanellensis]|uniref:MBL fold metallo-hydrolase n=1 Tax=Ruminococcus champanellensis TaxID=1161942 RepID=UPI0023F56D8E|nr:MBL fold metallo-hydrolase [Ruminococcus champanellensis]